MPALRSNRDFVLLWSGQTVSELGSQISLVAYPLLVLALTGSPAKAGIVGFAKALPIAALSLPAGMLADRMDRKRLMVGCNVVRALALAALAVGVMTGHAPFLAIAAVAFIDGSGFVVTYVAERGVLRLLVAREQLPQAVARNESRTFAAMLAGPPLGGVLFALGRAVPFAVDAASYAVSSAAMVAIRRPFQEARTARERVALTEGLRWLWQRPFLRACTMLFAASNPLFAGLNLLIVILAKREGASSAVVGLMLAVAAAGGLAGTLMAPALQARWRPHTSLVAESVAMALAVPVLLIAHEPLVFGLVVAAAELFTPVTNAAVVSLRVGLAPDRLQGRVQAASTLVSFSAGWLGPLAVGLLVQHAGTTTTTVILVAWAAVLALVSIAAPALRRGPEVR